MYKQYTLTFSGVAQRVSTGLGLADPTPALRHISFQPDVDCDAVIYIGDENVSDTDYAVRLEVPVDSVLPVPYVIEGYDTGPLRLSDFWVISTATKLLHIGVVEF